MKKILEPRTGSEVTKEWLQKILKQYCDANNETQADDICVVKSFEIAPACAKGENFNSDLASVEVTTIIKEQQRIFSLILKFESLVAFSKEANRYGLTHLREFRIFSHIHKTLVDFELASTAGRYPLHMPTYYYGMCQGNDYVIAMQNMKTLGYKTNDKRKGLDYHQLKVTLQQLAHWHAISYAYDQKHGFDPTFIEISVPPSLDMMDTMLGGSMSSVVALLKHKGVYEELRQQLECPKKILQTFREQVTGKWSQTLCCLKHGDFWNSNILFQQSEGTPTRVCFIDWQMSGWTTPVIDLQYLIHTSTTRETRQHHLEELLEYYHAVFTTVTTDLGVPVDGWNYVDFKREYNKYSVSGFLYGIALAQGTLSEGMNAFNQTDPASSPRSFAATIQSKVARGFFSLMEFSIVKAMTKHWLGKMMQPIQDELLSGSNAVMTDRVLGLCKDALDNKIFDIKDKDC